MHIHTPLRKPLHLAPKELQSTRTQLQATIDYSMYGAIERYVQDQNYIMKQVLANM